MPASALPPRRMGVNLPLAYVGQEAVLRQTLMQHPYNMTDGDMAPFFTGPAFLTWGRSQGSRGWGGPLPLRWIESHVELEKNILFAMCGNFRPTRIEFLPQLSATS